MGGSCMYIGFYRIASRAGQQLNLMLFYLFVSNEFVLELCSGEEIRTE
jgi:hypothetical protein